MIPYFHSLRALESNSHIYKILLLSAPHQITTCIQKKYKTFIFLTKRHSYSNSIYFFYNLILLDFTYVIPNSPYIREHYCYYSGCYIIFQAAWYYLYTRKRWKEASETSVRCTRILFSLLARWCYPPIFHVVKYFLKRIDLPAHLPFSEQVHLINISYYDPVFLFFLRSSFVLSYVFQFITAVSFLPFLSLKPLILQKV